MTGPLVGDEATSPADKRRGAAVLAALAFSGAAQAITLGDAQVRSALGQPLEARIPVNADPGDNLRGACFSLAPRASSGAAALTDADLALRRSAHGNYLEVRSHKAIAEPDARVSIAIACPGTAAPATRDFTLLLEPTLHTAPPQLAGSLALKAREGDTLSSIARAIVPEGNARGDYLRALREANPALAARGDDAPIAPQDTIALPDLRTYARASHRTAKAAPAASRIVQRDTVAATPPVVPHAPASRADATTTPPRKSRAAAPRAAVAQGPSNGTPFQLRLSAPEIDLSVSRNIGERERAQLRERLAMLDADDQVAAMLSLRHSLKQLEARVAELQLKLATMSPGLEERAQKGGVSAAAPTTSAAPATTAAPRTGASAAASAPAASAPAASAPAASAPAASAPATSTPAAPSTASATPKTPPVPAPATSTPPAASTTLATPKAPAVSAPPASPTAPVASAPAATAPAATTPATSTPPAAATTAPSATPSSPQAAAPANTAVAPARTPQAGGASAERAPSVAPPPAQIDTSRLHKPRVAVASAPASPTNYWIWIAGAVVALLLLALFVRWRRHASDEAWLDQPETAPVPGDDEIAPAAGGASPAESQAPAILESDADLPTRLPTTDAEELRRRYMRERFPELATGMVNLDDAASVVKAARLLYEDGAAPRAVELLQFALETRPEELRHWLALFEIYRLERLTGEFAALAKRFHERFGDSEHWEKVRYFGREIDAGNALYRDPIDTLQTIGPRESRRLAAAASFDPLAENWLNAPMDFENEVLANELRGALMHKASVTDQDLQPNPMPALRHVEMFTVA